MTTANRGESAPIARPADRPFSESQHSPPKPAIRPPSLATCLEMEERQGTASLPSCLRSREVARGAGRTGEVASANPQSTEPPIATRSTVAASAEAVRASRFIEQTRSPLPFVATTPQERVEVKGGDR